VASANESLRDLKIKLEGTRKYNLDDFNIYPCSSAGCTYGIIEIEKLAPGQNMTVNFRVELDPTNDEFGGGYLTLQASLVEAKGETTGQTYGSVFSDEVTISLCKFTELTYMKCFYFKLFNWGDPNCKDSCLAAGCDWRGNGDSGFCICETNVLPRCAIP